MEKEGDEPEEPEDEGQRPQEREETPDVFAPFVERDALDHVAERDAEKERRNRRSRGRRPGPRTAPSRPPSDRNTSDTARKMRAKRTSIRAR